MANDKAKEKFKKGIEKSQGNKTTTDRTDDLLSELGKDKQKKRGK